MINRSGFNRLCASGARRGNTLVLVSGILALLVIIAAAYISRTQAGRVTAVAEQASAQRDDNAQLIGDMLAEHVAKALFAQPVDYNPDLGTGDPEVFAGNTASSNWPRLSPERWNTVRYGVDRDAYDNTWGLPVADGLPDIPYNFAPYPVIPYTNWPDIPPADLQGIAQYWPKGPGNTNATAGTFSPYLAAEGNSLGNPGFGDTRWLSDTEPMRWDWDNDGEGDANHNGVPDRFALWRHLTYLGTANNGFRLCTDASDIGNADGDFFHLGTLITDLSLPVEQWMAVRPYSLSTGFDSVFPADPYTFWRYWAYRFQLFGTYSDYASSFSVPGFIPSNFYRLKDLNGNNFYNENGERRQDEFIRDTPRWNVCRVLADADGDGFTDSFWWLAPTPVEKGIRQIVAVRIIDNGSMLNVNAATRFYRNNTDIVAQEQRTRGLTPTDLALVSQLAISGPGEGPGTWDVGFYDAPAHHYRPWDLEPHPAQYSTKHRLDYLPARWPNHIRETGLWTSVLGFPSTAERLDYWRRAASRPLSPEPTSIYTPFGTGDELELRMYFGQNYPWIFSAFEHSVQADTIDPAECFLRAGMGQDESSEYLDQLPNYALLLDNRHKLTCFSGARNDEMPPWLRWRWGRNSVPNLFDSYNDVLYNNFLAQSMHKVDLREQYLTQAEVENLNNQGLLAMPQRLPYTLMLAFMDAYVGADGGLTGNSYFGKISGGGAGGDPSVALEKMRRFAAGYAANILAWRDADSDAPLAPSSLRPCDGAVPLPEIGGLPEDESTRFLGLEKQPFLTEAFIAHVYASQPLPPTPPGRKPLFGYPGNYVDSSNNKTTIVVVQIANPFDEPIDLSAYKIRVGDDTHSYGLSGWLYPTREDRPITATYYAIVEDFDHDDPSIGPVLDFREQWLKFLDLNRDSVPPHYPDESIIASVLPSGGPSFPTWSTNPVHYCPSFHTPSENNNVIELTRLDFSTGQTSEVVVDRFDYAPGNAHHNEFKTEVEGMSQPPEHAEFPDWHSDTEPEPSTLPGIRIGNNHWWVTWTRVTRAWGWDTDRSGENGLNIAIDADEKAPRFIFAEQKVVKPNPSHTEATKCQFDGDVNIDSGEADKYLGGAFVDITAPETPEPWITASYESAYGGYLLTRRPTFFDGNYEKDPANPDNPTKPLYQYIDWSYPDKGFYKGGKKALQMLLKNGDFETIGELRQVFMCGHELAFNPGGPGQNATYAHTRKTFSEFMSDPLYQKADQNLDIDINRITISTKDPDDFIGGIDSDDPDYSLFHPLHSVPDLPAGVRIWDAFVCDGRGFNWVAADGDTSLRNAAGFSGRPTAALINLNTAMPEVMQALPHWYKMVQVIEPEVSNPRVALPEAVVQYRERYRSDNTLADTILPVYGAPDYHSRDKKMHGDRGLVSKGELLLMGQAGDSDIPTETYETLRRDAWRIGFGYEDPFGYVGGQGVPLRSTCISTDLQDIYDYATGKRDQADETAGDVEEHNLLFSGASNLVTTRSDVFTIYFKIRSFRQNPTTGYWDATDPQYIVDESRWVMQVDRSEVNRPSDKPKILFLEKLPN